MENFAEYILKENNYIKKIELAYYLHKKSNMFFDESVICKAELARKFIETMNLDVDENLIITACLLYANKKFMVTNDFEKVKIYAKEGAIYLSEMGFDNRFCRICEGVNRYSGLSPREPESDILELVDNLGDLLLSKEHKSNYDIQQAMQLLINENLKDINNKYMEQFKEFLLKEDSNTNKEDPSSKNVTNENVRDIQKSNKEITELFKYVNEEKPTIGGISRKYGFEKILLRKKSDTNV